MTNNTPTFLARSMAWAGAAMISGCAFAADNGAPTTGITAALAAYEGGKFSQAAQLLKPIESTNGRAAGITCELFVRKLLPPDDERGQNACETAVKARDPHGLVWRGLAGHPGFATLGMPAGEGASLGYFAEAAELDYPPAIGRLCEYYYGKSKFQEAVSFCTYSAAREVPEALYYYGLMSLDGKGVVQDSQKALKALLLSAQRNYAPALLKLSEMSRDGTSGLPKNPVKAYSWALLALAAEPESKQIEDTKQTLAKELEDNKLSIAQKNAAAWKMIPAPSSQTFYGPKKCQGECGSSESAEESRANQ